MTLAFVFPGQGSQSVGMLNELAASHPEVSATFAEASSVLSLDLWELVSNGPAERLNQTEITQPVMFTAGTAVWRVWQQQQGPQPALMAGHSLGEYTALVCAGALAFTDALGLVADRARYMQAAVPVGEGAMAAIIGLDDQAVAQLCHDHAEGQVLAPVNYNAPGQVVIAGQKPAIDRAVANAKPAGAKRALVLPVSVPSHCQLMQPAAEQMAERLQDVDIKSPTIPVIHNVSATTEDNPEGIRQALVTQIAAPVRWVETIQYMAAQGVERVIECGPGKVLTGLNKRIDKQLQTLPVDDPSGLQQALTAVASVAASE